MTDKKKAGAHASQNQTPVSDVNSAARNGTVFMDIRRSDSERLRIGVSEYRGRVSVDLRAWYSVEGGEFKPSNRGLSLKPSQIPEVVQGLLLAARAFDPTGGV